MYIIIYDFGTSVENNEPEVFRKIYKWLDIGDYLVARCTGRIIRTVDTAFATFLYDTRRC